MKPVKASLHGAKRRFIFCGNAAKCFMRRKPRFIYHISPLALTDEALLRSASQYEATSRSLRYEALGIRLVIGRAHV